MEILSLGGQPTPQIWEHWDNWWISTRAQENVDNDPNSPTWILGLMWKSKMFMHQYWRLTDRLITNPFTFSVEEIVWLLQSMTQVSKQLK